MSLGSGTGHPCFPSLARPHGAASRDRDGSFPPDGDESVQQTEQLGGEESPTLGEQALSVTNVFTDAAVMVGTCGTKWNIEEGFRL